MEPLAHDPAPMASGAALIGPNAVLQLEQALLEVGRSSAPAQVFSRAGLGHLLTDRPAEMIDERLPRALFDSLFAQYPAGQAGRIAHRAGVLTGAYILHHRIPRLARILLKSLPAPVARDMLLKAIVRHAWTFAGSGLCTAQGGRHAVIEIAANPLAVPGCAWHVGVFEALFRTLVSPAVTVSHDRCCLDGEPACRFQIQILPNRQEATPS